MVELSLFEAPENFGILQNYDSDNDDGSTLTLLKLFSNYLSPRRSRGQTGQNPGIK